MDDELHHASQRIHHSRPAQGVLHPEFENLVDLLDAERCELLLAEEDRLTVVASSGVDGAQDSYPIRGSLVGEAFQSEKSWILGDLHQTRGPEAAQPVNRGPDNRFRSLCIAPVGDRGVLVAKATAPEAFDDKQADLAEEMAKVIETRFDQGEKANRSIRFDGGKRSERDEAEILDEVADIVSHDLKNPLNVAQGMVDLARETGEDEHFERAISSLQRMEELIDEIAMLARAGTLVQSTEVVDVEGAVRDAWANIETGDASLEIVSSAPILASRSTLVQLLENLIQNSVEHAGPAVQIRVGMTDDGFYVEDDGPGVPDEHRSRIFDRGFSLDRGHSGLGLGIVKRIAESHDWQIHLETASTGGARFEIESVVFASE